jgi:UDP-N-acetyl-D-glucosamine dehydrogenase
MTRLAPPTDNTHSHLPSPSHSHSRSHSRSPFGDDYSLPAVSSEEAHKQELERLAAFAAQAQRKTVVIQGLGFVGTAMAAALASAEISAQASAQASTRAVYNVIGIDLADEHNYWKIGRVNAGLSPVVSTDASLDAAYKAAAERGNLTATHLAEAYALADVVVVDIHLDIRKQSYGNPQDYSFTYDGYLAALRVVARHVKPDVLVLIETTVPPGTTEKVVKPLFEAVFAERGLSTAALKLAHSYERVMPGKEYLNSITNFYRVYSGVDAASRAAVRGFLSSFINTAEFPLTELHSTTASEMSKVLENSFRAANIAFIQEWTEFAQAAGVNLFDVIQAIRVRPTHRNIMAPGLGVGGYCLTKDSLLADWAYTNLFADSTVDSSANAATRDTTRHLGVSLNAVRINDTMPEFTFSLLQKALGSAHDASGASNESVTNTGLRGSTVTILGVSYLNDVADTRYSPTETLYDLCERAGATVHVHDTLVSYWTEKDLGVETSLEAFASHVRGKYQEKSQGSTAQGNTAQNRHHALVLAVRHSEYLRLSSVEILRLFAGVDVVIDGMNILNDDTAHALTQAGVRVLGIGKGHWR